MQGAINGLAKSSLTNSNNRFKEKPAAIFLEMFIGVTRGGLQLPWLPARTYKDAWNTYKQLDQDSIQEEEPIVNDKEVEFMGFDDVNTT